MADLIDPTRPPATEVASQEGAHRAFSRSMLISAVRCTLTYVVFPFVFPIIGLSGGVGPVLGLVIGTIAIVANVFSIRRFWAANHPWKVPVSILNVGIIVLLSILVAIDIGDLVG